MYDSIAHCRVDFEVEDPGYSKEYKHDERYDREYDKVDDHEGPVARGMVDRVIKDNFKVFSLFRCPF